MNTTLDALFKKLTMQLNELNTQIQTIKHHQSQLESDFQAFNEKINQVSDIPLHILPEQEMARLHFILHQQKQLDAIALKKIDLDSQYQTLLTKQVRLKIELKRLELYQLREHDAKQHQALVSQYQQDDEWSLLHREPA